MSYIVSAIIVVELAASAALLRKLYLSRKAKLLNDKVRVDMAEAIASTINADDVKVVKMDWGDVKN